jgi:uncharacterized membrane protein
MLLNAPGVYIGWRYNSWDAITNPFALAKDEFYRLIDHLHNCIDWSMIACFAVFLSLIYITTKGLSQSL